jgi:hypothetical protein
MEINKSMQSLYDLVLDMTIERVKREKKKATKLSRRTLKMIALVQELHCSTFFR